jgi:aminoglycoside phosphotransferase (APT) family kinase protein
MHALRQMPTKAPGFATRREVVTNYAREMNIDVSDWPVLRVLAKLKLAVVLLQLFALYQRGAAKGDDYADLDQVATELLAYATDVAHGRAD